MQVSFITFDFIKPLCVFNMFYELTYLNTLRNFAQFMVTLGLHYQNDFETSLILAK